MQRTAWIIFGLWLALYSSFALLTPPLLDNADALHAEVAREMLESHDLVTLYANGIRYLDQPPLLYWSMAANMRIFGVGTAAARFPLAVYAFLLFLVTAMFAGHAFDSERSALYAGVGLLSTLGIFLFTRILIPDIILTLWLTAAVYAFWLAETGPPEYTDEAPRWPCFGFAAACALGVLTKGLIAVIFPVAIVLIFLLLTRGILGTLRRLWQFHPIRSTLIFAAIAAPWHILAARKNPAEGQPAGIAHTGHLWPRVWAGWRVPPPTDGNVHGFAWYYFLNEHLLRYLHLHIPRQSSASLPLFWGLLLLWMLPWSAFLVHAIAAVPWRLLLHRATARQLDLEQQATTLLAIAALLPLVFFSVSTRHAYYALPSIPFFIILIARWLDREVLEAESLAVRSPLSRSANRITTGLFYAGCAIALLCGYLVVRAQHAALNVDLASLLPQNPRAYAFFFGGHLSINGRALALFRDPLALAGVSVLFGTSGAWWSRRNDTPHYANIALAVGAIGFLLAAHKAFTAFAPVLSSESLATQLAPQLRPKNLLVINGDYDAASALGFYLQRDNIRMLHGRADSLWYGSFFDKAPPVFETDASMRLRWQGPERVFLWTLPDQVPSLPGPFYVVAYGGGKEIVSNQANEAFITAPDGIKAIPETHWAQDLLRMFEPTITPPSDEKEESPEDFLGEYFKPAPPTSAEPDRPSRVEAPPPYPTPAPVEVTPPAADSAPAEPGVEPATPSPTIEPATPPTPPPTLPTAPPDNPPSSLPATPPTTAPPQIIPAQPPQPPPNHP